MSRQCVKKCCPAEKFFGLEAKRKVLNLRQDSAAKKALHSNTQITEFTAFVPAMQHYRFSVF